MKDLMKNIFAWLIMGVMVCSNTLFPLANEAQASDSVTGVSFESIQDTLSLETLDAVSGGNSLGQVSEASKGFIFKMTRPGVTSGQQNMKIGLYNTQENNVWAGGYILHLTTKSAEGELGWCVRRASDEAAFAFDTFTGLTGDEIRIEVWRTDLDEAAGTHTIHMALNGTEFFSVVNDGSIPTGCHMGVYNEWSQAVTFKHFETDTDSTEPSEPTNPSGPIEPSNPTDPSGPTEPSGPEKAEIPSDITFEDLGQTIEKNVVKTPAQNYGELGEISDMKHGFKFKVSCPGEGDSVKIGLYNTEVRNPWANGYILILSEGSKEQSVNWAVRLGNGEALVAFGILEGVTGDELTVYTWQKDTFHIVLNDVELVNVEMNSVEMGTFFCAYNEGASTMSFYTFTQVNAANTLLPTDTTSNSANGVTFEDLGITAKKNTLKVPTRDYGNMKAVSSLKRGFRFKLDCPDESDTGKNLKIGLYNPSEKDPWSGGYILAFAPGSKAGNVRWTLMNGKDETPIDVGEIENAGETIEVMAWLTDMSLAKHRLHIAINNKEVVVNQNDGSITVGKYMAAYNDWTNPAFIYTFLDVVEANQLLELDGSANAGEGIVFNDLSKTTYRNKVSASNKAVTDLGRVESLEKGFQFKLNLPKETDPRKVIKIGFYNTAVSNPWQDGYILALSPADNSNNLKWSLLEGKTEEVIESGELINANGSVLKIQAWLTDVSGGQYSMHVAVNGREIVACRNTGTIKLDTYMAIYNEWGKELMINSVVAPELNGDITGIEFEDLGITARLNEITASKALFKNLGKVSNKETGFRFLVSTPDASDVGKNLKIGLYNTAKKDPWADGYILVLTPREEQGNIGLTLIKGKDETKFAIADDLVGATDEFLDIAVWITNLDKKTGSHVMHIMVNGQEIIAYACEDGSVLLGTYMSVYSEYEQDIRIRTIREIETLTDRYLAKFGDPIAMRESSGKDEAKESSNSGNGLLYAIGGGVAIVAVGSVASILIWKKRKNKVNE